MNGILLVDKPEGLSSAAVVRFVKKALTVDKIGHLGTLDPFASGLLPLCLGAGAKLAQFLMAERKAYTGIIRLGVTTDTLDATGAVLQTAPFPDCEEALLRSVTQRFLGESWQTPPMYSALKRNGVPLYKLARRGVEVDREPRKIHIDQFLLTQLEPGLLSFSLTCSKGTYVRSLAGDIGSVLGCGAHLATLRRTEFGDFRIANALPLQQLLDAPTLAPLALLSLVQAMRQYHSVCLSVADTAQLRQGRQAVLSKLPMTNGQEILLLLDPTDELAAIAEWRQGQWRLARVF